MDRIKSNKRVGELLFVYLLILYPMVRFAIFYVGTNIKTILMAFQTVKGGKLVFAGLNNFIEIGRKFVNDALFVSSLKNSLIFFGVCFVVSNPLYIIFSYYIFKKRFGAKTLRFIIMLPSIVASMIMVLVFKRVVEDVVPSIFGINFPNLLLDGRYALWTNIFFAIWLSFSSNVLIYPNVMNTMSPEITESARLDGVNMFEEIWYIILPHIYPTFVTFFITGLAAIFADGHSNLTFYYYDKCPPEAYNMGYYLLVSTMRATNDAQLCIAATTGLMLTIVTAPLTLLAKWLLNKYGPSED